ncbi:26S proteasome subunit RPN7-domain-containing protein [Phlebopus sp. FC_14]|nr:26S proteasome subunit RPN7-domain-containing protein [Phlebopus sp. FC_14]
METELLESETPGQLLPIRSRFRTVHPVDDAHPFDLDAYISSYTGRTAVDRLIFIISTCPSIASQALKLAITRIQRLRDPSLYQMAISAYEGIMALPEGLGLPPIGDLTLLDTHWMEQVTRRNVAERTKLEVELKTYTNNMIKESIRMGHRDLGDFYRATGDYSQALKNYTKSREFCSTSQHVLDMCLSVLELVIEQRNYPHISSYIFKAEGALESAAAGGAGASATKKAGTDREQIQSKLDFALALSHLGHGNYEKAAFSFLRLGPIDQLGDWIGKLVSPGDIAIYGTLCALATLPRSAIKAQFLGNVVFSAYTEQEPYVRDLLQAYMSSDFKTVLELLSRYSTRHCVDIHLAAHVNELTQQIRNTAVVLYFQPFETIRLERMASAFGWNVEEVEREVVALIQSGQIQGRVDSQNKASFMNILKARKTDHRAELFAYAMKTAADIQNTNRKLLLRMRLQQADLVIKGPKLNSRREQDRALDSAMVES